MLVLSPTFNNMLIFEANFVIIAQRKFVGDNTNMG